MAWHVTLWHWLAHAALGSFLVLAVGCLAVRPVRQPVRRLRLARACSPAPAEVAELLERIAGPGARRVRLLASDRLDLPVMFGWRRPAIVLPGALCRSGDAAALRYCLAHEWSHVERGDML